MAGDLETKVKAAYLYHLTQFVVWPDLPDDHLHICVRGNDPVGGMLLELSNRRIRDRTLQIELDQNIDPASCHVLFISRSETGWKSLLGSVRHLNVLTVSDIDKFADSGGIVGFYSEAGKIKLEINPPAASETGLKISSKLMELARHVAPR